jgi:hypothetical protein
MASMTETQPLLNNLRGEFEVKPRVGQEGSHSMRGEGTNTSPPGCYGDMSHLNYVNMQSRSLFGTHHPQIPHLVRHFEYLRIAVCEQLFRSNSQSSMTLYIVRIMVRKESDEGQDQLEDECVKFDLQNLP